MVQTLFGIMQEYYIKLYFFKQTENEASIRETYKKIKKDEQFVRYK